MTGPDSDSSDGALPGAAGEPAPRTLRSATEHAPPSDAPPGDAPPRDAPPGDDGPVRRPTGEGERETDATLRSISRLEESN